MATAHGTIVVYNPALRHVRAVKKALAAELVRLEQPEATWVEASYKNPQALATTLLRASVVIVVGGDGLVRSVAEVLAGSGIPIGIVPSGTGNLLARNLQLPLGDVAKAVRVALGQHEVVMDVARATYGTVGHDHEQIFTVMAGLGLDADMAEGASYRHKKRYGWLAYVAPIVRSIVLNRQHTMVLRLDDRRPVAIKAHTAIVGNCGTLTANLLLLPQARVSDGRLDVVVLNPKAITGWTRIWSRIALSGALIKSKTGRVLLKAAPPIRALQYGQFERLDLLLNEPQPLQLDGDVVGEITRLRVSVIPSAVVIRTAAR